VPPHPGVLSAAGLLGAPVEHEVSSAYPQPFATASWPDVAANLSKLDGRCASLMQQEGIAPGAAEIRYFADICYIGQGYHLGIPLHDTDPDPVGRLYRDFLAAHDRVYGHATEAPARFVNLRSVHRVKIAGPVPASSAEAPHTAIKGHRPVLIDTTAGFETATVYDRSALSPGMELSGPAIVEQADTTVVLPRDWRCSVAQTGILILDAA